MDCETPGPVRRRPPTRLILLAVMVLGPAFPGWSGAQDGPFQPDPAGAGFTVAEVEKLARARAGQNFQPGEARVAEAWRGLTEAEWRGLAFKDEHRLWRGENLPFEVAFFPPGFIYDRTVTVEVVEQGRSRPVPFRPEMFRHCGADPGKKLSRD